MEKMEAFFAARVDGYDQHMLTNVTGCREGYAQIAWQLPEGTARLLDLGCGTGLELEAVFDRFPDIRVTGIDMTREMLDRLVLKYPGKDIELICASYFECDLGEEIFDAAISFQTMHHFPHADKLRLYQSIRRALKPGGRYVECDYMLGDQGQEDALFEENRRIRAELGIGEREFYHFDTPCTIDNQISLLLRAGFASAEVVWRVENTTMIVSGCW